MIAILSLLLCLSSETPSIQKDLEQDALLRAMVDEIDRSKKGVSLPDMPAPYFIEYGVFDGVTISTLCELGAATSKDETRYRNLRCNVRVGSYELDNMNFPGAGRSGGGRLAFPLEDDYNAIRQALWWATDRVYKGGTEDFAKKKAFMESKMIENKPDDFSKETPVVDLEKRGSLTLDRKNMDQLAAAISEIFKQYPEIQNSTVEMWGNAWNRYLVNSEGTRIRDYHMSVGIRVNASTQAEDGMAMANAYQARAVSFDKLPSKEELTASCKKLAENLIAASKAPRAKESYRGPVLFEPELVAGFLASEFGIRFCGGQRPVGVEASPDDFSQKLNKRIFPKGLSVVDDPTLAEYEGETVLSQCKYDDQGVKPRAVSLVEDGKLKTLLMSRNPSKEFKGSTGHGRAALPQGITLFNSLFFRSSAGMKDEDLRKKFIETIKDKDLEFGLRVVSGDSLSREKPLLVYKVYLDGHEELVRGYQFSKIDLKDYERIIGVGEKSKLTQNNLANLAMLPFAVAAPAVLFEEIDFGKIDKDQPKLPILSNPLTRKDSAKK